MIESYNTFVEIEVFFYGVPPLLTDRRMILCGRRQMKITMTAFEILCGKKEPEKITAMEVAKRAGVTKEYVLQPLCRHAHTPDRDI